MRRLAEFRVTGAKSRRQILDASVSSPILPVAYVPPLSISPPPSRSQSPPPARVFFPTIEISVATPRRKFSDVEISVATPRRRGRSPARTNCAPTHGYSDDEGPIDAGGEILEVTQDYGERRGERSVNRSLSPAGMWDVAPAPVARREPVSPPGTWETRRSLSYTLNRDLASATPSLVS